MCYEKSRNSNNEDNSDDQYGPNGDAAMIRRTARFRVNQKTGQRNPLLKTSLNSMAGWIFELISRCHAQKLRNRDKTVPGSAKPRYDFRQGLDRRQLTAME